MWPHSSHIELLILECDGALLPNPAPCPPPGSLFLQPLALFKAFLNTPTWVRSPFAGEHHFPRVYCTIACLQAYLPVVSGPPSAPFLHPGAYKPGWGTQYLPYCSLLIDLNCFLRPFLRSLHDFWLRIGKDLVLSLCPRGKKLEREADSPLLAKGLLERVKSWAWGQDEVPDCSPILTSSDFKCTWLHLKGYGSSRETRPYLCLV